MNNFSELNNLSTTNRDQLVSKMVSATGLDIKQIQNLYEGFAVDTDGSFDGIENRFNQLITPKVFDFETFKRNITELSKAAEAIKIDDAESSVKREMLSNDIIFLLNQAASEIIDTPTLLEVISFVLLLKNNNFDKVAEKIQFGIGVSKLFEDTRIDFTKINVNSKNTKEENLVNIEGNKKLYESLKVILSRNENRWGYNYHLDNAYDAIKTFLDKQIEELVNADNIVSIADNFHRELIDQLLVSRVNPMYRSIDILKNQIPDIQTLVFDLLLLVHNYVQDNKGIIDFISRESFIDYLESSKTLYTSIASSANSSEVLKIYSKSEQKQKDGENGEFATQQPIGTGYSDIFDKLQLDWNKFDTFLMPVRLPAAIDCLYIIKSCQNEFNLKIRGLINRYLTKSFEILAKSEKIILEQSKTNKYKNSYLY